MIFTLKKPCKKTYSDSTSYMHGIKQHRNIMDCIFVRKIEIWNLIHINIHQENAERPHAIWGVWLHAQVFTHT